MGKVILVCGSVAELEPWELDTLYAKFGPVSYESSHPSTPEEHCATCAEKQPSAVYIPFGTALRAIAARNELPVFSEMTHLVDHYLCTPYEGANALSLVVRCWTQGLELEPC